MACLVKRPQDQQLKQHRSLDLLVWGPQVSPVVSGVLFFGTIEFPKNSELGRHLGCVPVFTVAPGAASKAIWSIPEPH